MSLLTATQLSLAFGKKTILDDASFSINAHDRIGLVGPNGTGKSTLLKALSGNLQLDSGKLTFMRGVRAGYLPQDILELPPGTLLESVLSAVPDRTRLDERLTQLERGLELEQDPEDQLDLAAQLADLHEELAAFEERYGAHQAERILMGLGFTTKDLTRPVTHFSGGWKMRAALAGLLLMNPELLLLDEPTNHLDLPSLLWFDGFLKRSAKAVVLVSHDRDFLNRQIDRVLSFEMEGLRGYSGNYDDYRKQRVQEEQELVARAERQAERRAEIESFVDRFRAKASKAKQVQSRIKLLEKEEILQTLETRASIHFKFPEALRSGREVARYDEVSRSFGEKRIYQNVSQTVVRGDRIAIVGVNGSGKTTLLKLTAGELPLDQGTITLGHNVQLAYYAQHHTDLLDRQKTILEEIWQLVPEKPQAEVRRILGAFLFSGDDVDKKIGVLSGGERARVALARLLVLPSNLILMDEPTNHLDIASSEQLIASLQQYNGTLLFVSHNRSFIDQLATRVWDVRDGRIVDWPGNLNDYLYHQAQQAPGESASPARLGSAASGGDSTSGKESEKDRRRREAQEREELAKKTRPLKRELGEVEARIATLEATQQELEPALADPALYQDAARAKAVNDQYQTVKQELEQCLDRWATLQGALEALATQDGTRDN